MITVFHITHASLSRNDGHHFSPIFSLSRRRAIFGLLSRKLIFRRSVTFFQCRLALIEYDSRHRIIDDSISSMLYLLNILKVSATQFPLRLRGDDWYHYIFYASPLSWRVRHNATIIIFMGGDDKELAGQALLAAVTWAILRCAPAKVPRIMIVHYLSFILPP